MVSITQRDGERIIAENISSKAEYLPYLKHLFAYDFLKQFKETRGEILEIGFGSAYGTVYVSEFVHHVYAIEVDQETVDYAKSKYSDKNITFLKFDGSRIPFEDNHFELIYFFQVIEHIEQDQGFLREVRRVLAPGGKAIFTTPNRLYRLKEGEKPRNPFHIREYSPQQMKDLVKGVFSDFEVLGVKGRTEVQEYEINRVKAGMGHLDPLGLRRVIPESVKKPLRNFMNSLRGKKLDEKLGREHLEKYSLNDYFIERDDIDSTLDLLVIAKKEV